MKSADDPTVKYNKKGKEQHFERLLHLLTLQIGKVNKWVMDKRVIWKYHRYTKVLHAVYEYQFFLWQRSGNEMLWWLNYVKY